MVAHEVYAMIADGAVQNICVSNGYEEANYVAKCVYGDEAYAVECNYCPCQMGDTYKDGEFYGSEGEKRTKLMTPEQKISKLQEENVEMILALADLIGGVSE